MARVKAYELRARFAAGAVLERYTRLIEGSTERLPKHAHPEYQIGLHLNAGGYYTYRGALCAVPPGGFSVLHTGEAHTTGDGSYLPAGATFLMLYLAPDMLSDAAEAVTGRRGAPFFGNDPVLPDQHLAHMLLDLHREVGRDEPLADESRLLAFSTELVRRKACSPITPTRRLTPTAVLLERARDYLHAHAARRDITLADLAMLTGLNRHHFIHEFTRRFGLPPWRYLVQLRVMQAKGLLLQGAPVHAVAAATGFFDTAHLSRHFQRVVGVTPGAYRRLT